MLEGRKGAGEWVGGRTRACYTDAPTRPLGVGGARRSLSATATSEDTGGREGITTGRNGVAKDDDDNVIDDRGASRTSSFAARTRRRVPRAARRWRERGERSVVSAPAVDASGAPGGVETRTTNELAFTDGVTTSVHCQPQRQSDAATGRGGRRKTHLGTANRLMSCLIGGFSENVGRELPTSFEPFSTSHLHV